MAVPQFTSPFSTTKSTLPQLTPFGQPAANACGLQSANLTPLATASSTKRKRSIDDVDSEEEYFPKTVTPSNESSDDWEMGEGMTLQRKNALGGFITAASQSDALAKSAIAFPQTPTSIERPILRNHKSMRLNTFNVSATGATNAPNSSPTRKSPAREGPKIDDYTLHLGIGWSRVSADEDMQAAVRGWQKYIENHFPITSPVILLQSRALESYLVQGAEGFFLIDENLKQGRLVATTVERTFEHLKVSPPSFDGIEVLQAKEDAPVIAQPSSPICDVLPPSIEMDEPHVYAASQRARQEFLQTLGEGAGESLNGNDFRSAGIVNRGDVDSAYARASGVGLAMAAAASAAHEAVMEDAMDMS